MEELKLRFKNETKKIGELKGKDKLEYIWEYYKLPIIGLIILAIIIGSIVNYILNPPKKLFLGLAFMSSYQDQDAMDGMAITLDGLIIPEELREGFTTRIDTFFVGSDDPQMIMAYQQKFAAMVSTNELDILVIGVEELEGYLEGEVLGDLRMILSDEELARYGDYIVYGASAAGSEVPYGIKIEGNSFLTENNFWCDGQMMVIVVNTSRADNVNAAVNLVMSGEIK